MKKLCLPLAVFGLALVANPYLACSSNQHDFSYGEADMKSAVLGRWEGTADIDGESVDFALVLEQASGRSKTQSVSGPKAQPQCASRSFVKPAGACESLSQMPVSGTLTSINPDLNGPVDGQVTAYLNLDHIEIALRLDDGTQLEGAIEKQALSDGVVARAQRVGGFSLSRP